MTSWTEADAARGALFLDELLRHPEYATIATEIRKATPVDLLDQGDAAAQHIADGIARVATQGDLDQTKLLPPGEHPDWVRLGAMSTIALWVTGRGDTCTHSPDMRHPQPVVGAAWKPRLITCGRCTRLFRLGNADKDATCDSCGRVTTGIDNNDGITSATVAIGFIVWMFGVCSECRYWNEEAS